MTKNDFKERLLAIRNLYKLNQTDFGAEIGMSQSNYSKIELGKVKPSKTVLYALMARFAINPDWVLTGQGEMFLSAEDYLDNGIKLLGMAKFSEGLSNLLKNPDHAELRSLLAVEEAKERFDQKTLDEYLKFLSDLGKQDDVKLKTWLMVQLERAFPEVLEKKK
ncbi:helix-turn-helix protein [Hydrogenispora ethanolica]|uniref:Helix-turn-helix protein n=1 Tax=Hydrogenispora ethanolica TaxID=1082276 RepID=A0A4R1QP08_HYDET|nr:helix-turn-helix transcriptional regulator [Hydrogenispora ethanolica]TCL54025.1 helix-turn-helix protein [Hydrogenispora ethanolica]